MVEWDRLAIPNLVTTIDEAVEEVCKKHGVKKEDLTVRLMKADDWDSFRGTKPTESDYIQNYVAGDNIWQVDKVESMYAVVFIGMLLPTLSTNLAHVECWKSDKKVREYPGSLVYLQENNIFLAIDPFYIHEKLAFKVIVNATAAQNNCEDYPLVVGIYPKGG